MENDVMRRLAEAIRKVENNANSMFGAYGDEDERLISIMADRIATAIEDELPIKGEEE